MGKDLIEAFARRVAKRTTRDGKPHLTTDGDPVLVDAFAALGWDDPYPDPGPEEVVAAKAKEDADAAKAAKAAEKSEKAAIAAKAEEEAATLRDAERATLRRPKGRVIPPPKRPIKPVKAVKHMKKQKGRRA